MKTVTVEQMRELDSRTIIEAGIPARTLMKTAGEGAAKALLEFVYTAYHQRHIKRFVLFAGKGNNGGDAYVAARYLYFNSNLPVMIFTVTPDSELEGDSAFYANLIPDDLPVVLISKDAQNNILPLDLQRGDIIVDGLLGTGVKGRLRAPYDTVVSVINNSGCPVIALDITSGLNGDDGSVANLAVKADLTLTIGLPKRGFLLGEGPGLCGLVKCIDIGIPQIFIDEISSDFNMILSSDIDLFERRPMNSYKNRNGHILIIGGSSCYPGAPLLAAMAAMRSGAGLVTLAVPESANIATPNMHSLIFRRINDSNNGTFSEESLPELEALIGQADAVVVGPGITTERGVDNMLRGVLRCSKITVVDADALNLIAQDISILQEGNGKYILTPHYGEFRRLMNAISLHVESSLPTLPARIQGALTLAEKLASIVVLKGHHTVIADKNGKVAVNGSGSPSLATAGSGDVLSGIIAAFSMENANLFDTTATAVYIHGVCGELSMFGSRGTVADDLVDLIPEAMRKISVFA